ncbi:MAG: aminoacyl-tRNA hydrolase [Phycisphaerales bacterium JB043]
MIVGLGNPGREYENTRHNAGYLVVDRLLDRCAPGQTPRSRFNSMTWEASIPGIGKCMLTKPLTFMNLSGQSVLETIQFYKLDPAEDLLVIVDDTALDIGSIRLRASGGTGGHNGLADISNRLNSDDYARLRIGIGDRGRIPQKHYVLGKLTDEQQAAIEPAIDKAADCALHWMRSGAISAMNTFNTKPETRTQPPAEATPESEPTTSRVGESTPPQDQGHQDHG